MARRFAELGAWRKRHGHVGIHSRANLGAAADHVAVGAGRVREWALATAAEPEEVIEQFSVFDERHLARALEVKADLMRLANAEPAEDAREEALNRYARLQGHENPNLSTTRERVHHPPSAGADAHPRDPTDHAAEPRAGRTFDRAAHEAAHGIETLAALRRPLDDARRSRVGPSNRQFWSGTERTRLRTNTTRIGTSSTDPANAQQMRFKDRQGDVFFYMHQQTLAGSTPSGSPWDWGRCSPCRITMRRSPSGTTLGRTWTRTSPSRGSGGSSWLAFGAAHPASLHGWRSRAIPARPSDHRSKYSHVEPMVEMVNPDGSPYTEPNRLGHAIEATNISIGVADQLGTNPMGTRTTSGTS